MALAFVQKASNAGNAATTLTVTISATQNNLMVGTMFTRGVGATNPTGFTTDIEIVNATEDDRLRITSKIAGAAEGNPQWTGLSTGDGNGTAAGVIEYSGNATSTPADKTASTGRTAAVTAISTSTTGVLTQADEVAVAAVGHRITVTAVSWNSSFAVENSANSGDGSGNVAMLVDGDLIVSATTALNPQQSWTTSDLVIAAIVTYKAAAAAGGGTGWGAPFIAGKRNHLVRVA